VLHDIDHLSIWEVAHRWANLDPDHSDPKQLPIAVKDAFRRIAKAVQLEHIPLCNEVGIQGRNYIYSRSTGKRIESEECFSALDDCLHRRRFDRDLLSLIYLPQWEFGAWLCGERMPLPDFWFPEEWCKQNAARLGLPEEQDAEINDQPKVQKNPINAQVDKQLCQAIARTLWDQTPNMTIAAVCRHKAVLQYGNGSLYKGKDTLRNWLREVAPEAVRGRRGRPRNPNTEGE
jgi:hypothetical protein